MRIDIDDPAVDAGHILTYQGRPFTGEVIETTRAGQVVALTNYRAGYEDGLSLEWYPGGALRTEGTVKHGIAVGLHREWHADGRLAGERRFDEHGNQLTSRAWDENGVLTEDKSYR